MQICLRGLTDLDEGGSPLLVVHKEKRSQPSSGRSTEIGGTRIGMGDDPKGSSSQVGVS